MGRGEGYLVRQLFRPRWEVRGHDLGADPCRDDRQRLMGRISAMSGERSTNPTELTGSTGSERALALAGYGERGQRRQADGARDSGGRCWLG